MRVIPVLLLCLAPLAGQNFDSSGNSNLNGSYLFRYVVYSVATSTGAMSEGCSVTGQMAFDGNGHYTIGSAQVFDTVTSRGSCAQPVNGTYALQPNGLAQLDNPLFNTTAGTKVLYGTFSQPILTASSTEESLYDVFVAVQAPSAPTTNAALKGAYQVGTLEFLNAQNSLARQGWFTMNPDGAGNLGALKVNGSAANLGTTSISQTVTGATYTLSGNGTGTLTIPGSGQGQLVSGTKTLYLSADGNYVIGGSTSGLDIIFGFKAAATGASNALYSGTYFTAGLEGDLSQVATNYSFLDSFYGSINANGSGTAIWHQRFNDQTDGSTFDYTFSDAVTIGPDGISAGGTYTTLVGANGQAFIVMGSGTTFAMDIGVRANFTAPGSGIWINPIGITNAANYTPLTNSYAAGELVNIYGNFGVPAQSSGIPVPTSLGGVQLMVNGTAAPIWNVGPNQISALIPFAVNNDSFASFQAIVNGAKSNVVTVYTNYSAPGVYTLTQNGVGPSAILHSNFTTVTSSSPAQAGETVLLFLNGLGTVTPAVADGLAGPSSPLSNTDGVVSVILHDGVHGNVTANVAFAGLAPGFPGLYQVNFQVPSSGLNSGTSFVSLGTDEAITEMSTIQLAGFVNASAVRGGTRARRPVAPAGAARSTRRSAHERSRSVSPPQE